MSTSDTRHRDAMAREGAAPDGAIANLGHAGVDAERTPRDEKNATSPSDEGPLEDEDVVEERRLRPSPPTD